MKNINLANVAGAVSASTEAIIKLGTQANAKRLFSYPNPGHETDTLEQTIEHYFSDSLAREGLTSAVATAKISVADCMVCITGLSQVESETIQTRYQKFFDIGQKGLRDIDALAVDGKLDKAWQFLLPLGLPIAYARAVEVMDFPPVTLIKNQDYLKSKTTERWWELLKLNAVPASDLALFSCILDIAPVAAPASDGAKFDALGIYDGPFDSYDFPLLEILSRSSIPNERRPLIALGMPIRKWVQRNWNLKMEILDVGTLTLQGGGTCPIIASNHPSFFFYAVHSNTGPGSVAKNLAAGLAVMKQDIVAAAWHAEMGRNPSSNPAAVLTMSQAKWQGRDAELLDLVKKQGGITDLMTMEISSQFLAEIQKLQPNAQDLTDLERHFYESRSNGFMAGDR